MANVTNGLSSNQLINQDLRQDNYLIDSSEEESSFNIFNSGEGGALTEGAANRLAPLNFHSLENKTAPTASKKLIYSAQFLCVAAAASLFALQIIHDFGFILNAGMTIALGFLAFLPIATSLPKNISDGVKDAIIDYGVPTYYFFASQILNNVGNDNDSTGEPWRDRLGYGAIFTAFGAILAAQVHNIMKWQLPDDRAARRDAELSLLNVSQAEPESQVQQDHRISVLFASHARPRVRMGLIMTAIGVAGIVTGYLVSHTASDISLKFGYLVTGISLGALFWESYRSWLKKCEKEHQGTQPIPRELWFARLVGKVALVGGFFLSGLVGFNTHYTDTIGGFFYGVLGQIFWINYTRTPVSAQDELQVRTKDLSRSFYKQIANVVVQLVWFGFYISQMVLLDDYISYAAITSLTASFILGYLTTVRMDKYDILNQTNPILNTLYFYSNYYITAPILFVAITQVMEIGGSALDEYGISAGTLASIAYIDFGLRWGFQLGTTQSERNRDYPANVNSLIFLYVYFLSQLIQGVATISGD